jgi:hypothetical protein
MTSPDPLSTLSSQVFHPPVTSTSRAARIPPGQMPQLFDNAGETPSAAIATTPRRSGRHPPADAVRPGRYPGLVAPNSAGRLGGLITEGQHGGSGLAGAPSGSAPYAA